MKFTILVKRIRLYCGKELRLGGHSVVPTIVFKRFDTLLQLWKRKFLEVR